MGDFSEDSDSQVSFTWTRDSSRDTVILSQPQTLYADSTILATGMTLYDNTGTDTGLKIGTISGDSFDIQTYYAQSGTEDYHEKIPGDYPGVVYTTTENPSVGDTIYTSADGDTDTIMSVSGSSFMSNGLGTTCSYTRESQYDNNNLSAAYFVTLTGSAATGPVVGPITK